jgi:hypothetical protein
MADLDVVFLAPAGIGRVDGTCRRTIPFAPGEPVPRIGECVVLAFGTGAVRWTVEDVAHVFGDAGHEIAIRFTWASADGKPGVSTGARIEAQPPLTDIGKRLGTTPVGR